MPARDVSKLSKYHSPWHLVIFWWILKYHSWYLSQIALETLLFPTLTRPNRQTQNSQMTITRAFHSGGNKVCVNEPIWQNYEWYTRASLTAIGRYLNFFFKRFDILRQNGSEIQAYQRFTSSAGFERRDCFFNSVAERRKETSWNKVTRFLPWIALG